MHALGRDKVGDKTFYAEMKDKIPPPISHAITPNDSFESPNNTSDNMDDNGIGRQNSDVMDYDEGGENLDILLNLIRARWTDIGKCFYRRCSRQKATNGYSIPHRTKKILTVYMDTVNHTELAKIAGTRRMHVQPTAISRRVTKGSKMAQSGRPPKRTLSEPADLNTRTKS